MPLVEEYVMLRDQLDRQTPRVLALFSTVAVEMGDENLRTALGQTGFKGEVDLSEERRANVPVPVLNVHTERSSLFYSLLSTPATFDRAVAQLDGLFSLILRTAEKEEGVRRLAKEIERTRRRVNALEYILIPGLLRARKFIQAKLDEDERASRVRNMKVKELLEKAAAKR